MLYPVGLRASPLRHTAQLRLFDIVISPDGPEETIRLNELASAPCTRCSGQVHAGMDIRTAGDLNAGSAPEFLLPASFRAWQAGRP